MNPLDPKIASRKKYIFTSALWIIYSDIENFKKRQEKCNSWGGEIWVYLTVFVVGGRCWPNRVEEEGSCKAAKARRDPSGRPGECATLAGTGPH